MAVPKRFGILRLVGNALKVIAWLILVVSVLFAIVAGIAAPAFVTVIEPLMGTVPDFDPTLLADNGLAIGIITLIAGLIYFLILYAAGESILLRVAVEENTRLTAALLLRMHQDSQMDAEPDYGVSYGADPYPGR
ncbi:MAG: hypothetical protein AAF702_14130 [Chloroflexota bacterium]